VSLGRRVAGRIRGRGKLPRVRSQVHDLELPLARDEATGWRPHPLFRGSTRVVGTLGCHVSVLERGHSPHPPHRHADEELLIVLDGEAELVLESGDHRAARGTLAYYPSGYAHTIRNVSERPVTYAMLKWTSWTPARRNGLGPQLLQLAPASADDGGYAMEHILEGATRWLGALRVHTTTMRPGGGYGEHRDPYDVWVLVLEGAVETLGRRVGTDGIVFYARGEPHGLRNTGPGVAFYLVVELRARRPLLRRR
jgi:quercetin dioxygenase-like cupin family protein